MQGKSDGGRHMTASALATQNTGASGHNTDRQQKLRNTKQMISPNFPVSSWNMHETIMFADRISLSRILYYDRLYRTLVGVPGVICEFGVQYGATMSLLLNLRGLYEPHNFLRKVIGFDTFEGFPDHLTEEERNNGWTEGDFSVPENYVETLTEHLDNQESFSPISHKRKFELVKGDVTKTFDSWLEENPGTLIGMAILDFDIYEPTKFVLERLLPRMPKGGIIVFDEMNHPLFGGEAVAVQEVLGFANLRLRMDPTSPQQAWCMIE